MTAALQPVLNLLLLICLATGTYAKQKMYQGVNVGRHVPIDVLPIGSFANVIDVHYRLVGPDCDVKKVYDNGLHTAINKAFKRVNDVSGLIVELKSMTVASPALNTPEGDEEEEDGTFASQAMKVAGSLRQFHAVDIVLMSGVDRGSSFPDIGAQEWTYCRMMETMLRSTGAFDTRFLIRNLTVIPEGLHVLKHIPMTPHYPDRTVLQLRGRNLLPFGQLRQNLLAVCMDYLGFNLAANTAFIVIEHVSTAQDWDNSQGQLGVVNVTLLTISDNNEALFGLVLAERMDALVERLDSMGLPHITGRVLSSVPASGCIHDQIASMLPPGDVTTYDQRVARRVPMFPSGVFYNPMPWMRTLQLAVVFALVAMGVLAGGHRLMARWRRPALLQQQPSASLARNSQPGRRGLVSLSPDIARVSLQSSKSAEEAGDYQLPHSSGSELRLRASASRDAMPGSRGGVPLGAFQTQGALPEGTQSMPAPRARGELATRPPGAGAAQPAKGGLPGQHRVAWLPSHASAPSTSSSHFEQLHEDSEVPASALELSQDSGLAQREAVDLKLMDSTGGANPNPFDMSQEWTPNSVSIQNRDDSARASSLQTAPSLVAQRHAAMDKELERIARVDGWLINASEIAICTREDGSDWLLGVGGFGQVYRGKINGIQDVAVKTLLYGDELHHKQFLIEINLLRSLSFNRNIVQFYGACMQSQHPMLVLEYCEGGDLRSALSATESNLAEYMRWDRHGHELFMDVACGLAFLHQKQVRHGDLKSKNVLLTKGAEVAKLSDVGMARILTTTQSIAERPTKHDPGTFAYAAPELILGHNCLCSADIYSMGVLLHEMITKEPPHRGQMRPLEAPKDCPAGIRDLMAACMLEKPSARPSARELFESVRDTMQQHARAVSRLGSARTSSLDTASSSQSGQDLATPVRRLPSVNRQR